MLFWMVGQRMCPVSAMDNVQPGAVLQAVLGWVSCTLPLVFFCFVRAGLLSVQAAGTEAWRMMDIEQSL